MEKDKELKYLAEIERLKKAEGALNYLLGDSDLLFGVHISFKVAEYLEKRRVSQAHWIEKYEEYLKGGDKNGKTNT